MSAFARRLGVPVSSYHKYEGGTPPPPNVLAAIAKIAEVSLDWLVTGEGPRQSGRVAETTAVYQTDKSVRELLKEATDKLEREKNVREVQINPTFEVLTRAEWKKRAADTNTDPLVALPLLSGAAAAGDPREVDENDIEGWCIIYDAWCPHANETNCIRVDGDSMEPALCDGSIVAVDHAERDPVKLEGKIVAALVDDGVVVKRLRFDDNYWMLDSDNRDKQTIVLPRTEAANPIIGKIVWSWNQLK